MTDDLLKKVLGTYLPDENDSSKPSVIRWAQKACREGLLQRHVQKFVSEQVEELDSQRVIVDSITPTELLCRIPAKISDHESLSAFRVDVVFSLNPLTGETVRKE